MTINTIIIDIETLDIAPTAVILSVGAFTFDRFNLDEARNRIEIANLSDGDESTCFYYVCDIIDQLILDKRTISNKTLDWWRSQSDIAKNDFVFCNNHIYLKNALTQLIDKIEYWKNTNPDIKFYFRGTDFDPVILKNAFEEYNLSVPWKYNQVRDIRTYIDALTGGNKGYIEHYKPSFEFIKHNALHDAMNDAEQMCVAYNISKIVFNQT